MSSFWQIMTALGAGSAASTAGEAAKETKELKKIQAQNLEEQREHNHKILKLQEEQLRLASMTDEQKIEYQKQKVKEKEVKRKEKELFGDFDPYNSIVKKVIECSLSVGKFSRGYIQGRLGINNDFVTALAIWFEEMGIIGPINGDKARDLLISSMEEYEIKVQEYIKRELPIGVGDEK